MSNFVQDSLTYSDVGGKRHPYRYVIAAVMILTLMCAVWGYTSYGRAAMMAEVQATPQAIISETPTLPAETAAAVAAALALLPTHTPIPTETLIPTATALPCAIDPEAWKLVDVSREDNLKRIEPACVYQGLGRAVAWLMAVDRGYSPVEAAALLDFDKLPSEWDINDRYASIKTNSKGPMKIGTGSIVWLPDAKLWLLTADLVPQTTYVLRGCFRTYDIVGAQKRVWNDQYPVICTVSRDNSTAVSIYAAGETLHSHRNEAAKTNRQFVLFGYHGDGNWVTLGYQSEPTPTFDDPEEASRDQQLMVERYGAALWNTEWLLSAYGIAMAPIPSNWQAALDDQAALDKINAQLAAYARQLQEENAP